LHRILVSSRSRANLSLARTGSDENNQSISNTTHSITDNTTLNPLFDYIENTTQDAPSTQENTTTTTINHENITANENIFPWNTTTETGLIHESINPIEHNSTLANSPESQFSHTSTDVMIVSSNSELSTPSNSHSGQTTPRSIYLYIVEKVFGAMLR